MGIGFWVIGLDFTVSPSPGIGAMAIGVNFVVA